MTNSALWITLAGMIGLAVIAVGGRRKRAQNLSEWTVGKRNFGVVTSFFLQAGESFTTFTFLGVAGIAFTAGIGATYAIPYIPLGYVACISSARGSGSSARTAATSPRPTSSRTATAARCSADSSRCAASSSCCRTCSCRSPASASSSA